MTSPPPVAALNLAWLRHVRWFVWLAQSLLILWATYGLGIHLQVGWLAGLLVLGLSSNAGLWWWQRSGHFASEGVVLAVMLFDVVLHTAVFSLSGGPFNPFTALYLVNVALGTLVLSRGRQWVQWSACLLGFGSLFLIERWAPAEWDLPHHAELMRMHLTGMWLAFIVASALIVASMQRVLTAVRGRDAELAEARHRALRNEKLAALTTLAAGAAHELATPLGTIAIASKELSRALDRLEVPLAAREDAALVRTQVQRCRDILSRMSVSSGEVAAEGFTRQSVDAWVSLALADLSGADRVTLVPAQGLSVFGPRRAMAQALASLVRNGLQASTTGVEVRARVEKGAVVMEVEDDGPGVDQTVLSRIGEPFFTTREPGAGMGLGVFLARTLAEQLGGTLQFESRSGCGTVARLAVPLDAGATP